MADLLSILKSQYQKLKKKDADSRYRVESSKTKDGKYESQPSYEKRIERRKKAGVFNEKDPDGFNFDDPITDSDVEFIHREAIRSKRSPKIYKKKRSGEYALQDDAFEFDSSDSDKEETMQREEDDAASKRAIDEIVRNIHIRAKNKKKA